MNEDKSFDLKEYRNIYEAVGKIIEESQELEQTFKQFAFLKKAKIDNLEIATLNRLNENFYNKKFYNEEIYNKLKIIIEKRNYVNHELFLELRRTNKIDYNKVSDNLNNTLFLIFEASDLIQNLIDKLNGHSGNRPTIFDE